MRQRVEDYDDSSYWIFVLREEDPETGAQEEAGYARVRSEERFATEEEALDWVAEDLDCVDNFRFAYIDDETSVVRYWEQYRHGCCGSMDEMVLVGDRLALVGCNYGH